MGRHERLDPGIDESLARHDTAYEAGIVEVPGADYPVTGWSGTSSAQALANRLVDPLVGIDRKGYIMPIDGQLAVANGNLLRPQTNIPSELSGMNMIRMFWASDDIQSRMRKAVDQSDRHLANALDLLDRSLMDVITSDPALRPPAIEFYEGLSPGTEQAERGAEGWTPATRRMARDLLALQDGFGYPDGLQPPDRYPENTGKEPPQAQQEQPRGEQ